jgi:hypothetical protein
MSSQQLVDFVREELKTVSFLYSSQILLKLSIYQKKKLKDRFLSNYAGK